MHVFQAHDSSGIGIAPPQLAACSSSSSSTSWGPQGFSESNALSVCFCILPCLSHIKRFPPLCWFVSSASIFFSPFSLSCLRHVFSLPFLPAPLSLVFLFSHTATLSRSLILPAVLYAPPFISFSLVKPLSLSIYASLFLSLFPSLSLSPILSLSPSLSISVSLPPSLL